ncbi:L-ribulose-5-phosphate 4-epimerase [Corynebacterium sp. CCM 9185]|uniref:L-ribulose-5-phosphate 4-epimerase n=1 Tax=Corynebacterium marambiense TaxID=2765364 RepID=A0ABS0VV87_9CORY|nr:L-ribulose-5-phosphate 4-epimerase [Corynebacterium marambiense]MBI9000683.1 class II aldolase/adducin family protein [Corynebacterium marambiense]MCK7663054.1 L-ribulose-5-phosphate 4-epimerase [Corynebacterium marambiense]MCX7542668.1 L-ribulose-5-phosphate 4-epimerase [Corynebacterium marambiense]
MMLKELREQVCEGNLALPRHGLVAWTGGNLSALADSGDRIVIKPSGRLYTEMTPDDMVIVSLDGRIIEGTHGPSSDTSSHLGIYRGRDDVKSVVHTHSTYATAWAALGEEIPCCLTAISDEFGGPIPCGGYARIGGNAIGEEILRSIGHSPAILMKQHGVFTIGPGIQKALQAAVMVEDVAHTMWAARLMGTPIPLPEEEIAANFDRYTHRYGTAQASEGVTENV